MSATTPGMRHIWMDAIVQCIEQRMANVADVCTSVVRNSSVVDTADSAGQDATSLAGETSDRKTLSVSCSDDATVKCSQAGSDRTDLGLLRTSQSQSGDVCQMPASSSDNVLQSDSKSTEVCNSSLFITVAS